MMQVKFIGYDTMILYDDYDRYEIIVQDINNIADICKTLENRDDTFEISYKKKYELTDGSCLYSEEEHFSIDNPTMPKKELLLRKFNNISKTISNSVDVRDEDIKKCYDILYSLVSLNHESDKVSFIHDIINIFKIYNLSLGHEDTQGAFKIEEYSKENIEWLKESLIFFDNKQIKKTHISSKEVKV